MKKGRTVGTSQVWRINPEDGLPVGGAIPIEEVPFLQGDP